jgi:hypothetical protein
MRINIYNVMPSKEGNMDTNEAMKRIEEEFGSRLGFLSYQVTMLSMTRQPCDVTFYNRKPALDVTIDQKINIAIMYGAGAKKLKEMLDNIKLSNGGVVNIGEVWTINPMPKGGFSEDELAAVDLAQAEEKVGPNGETLRKMISDTYHCQSRDEEDRFLRRFIAS